MNMKNILARLASVVAVFMLVPAAWGAGGIALSLHNFANQGTPATGLCTYCHTPHSAASQSLLWNRALVTTTYSWTDPATTGGTTYPSFDGDTYLGISSKCLSCHDGSVAVGLVAHWNAAGPVTLPGDPITGIFQIGALGDMDGNHPVAMPFPFGGVASLYNGSTNGAEAVLSGWQADPTAAGIRLFTDDGSGNITAGVTSGQTGMECTSCHDVHNGPLATGPFLLRGNLGGSDADYICNKCHVK